MLAAVALANCRTDRTGSVRGRRREFNRACTQVSEHLGNTATVARRSYIHPRVAEAFEHGRTIERAVGRAARNGTSPEEARDIVEPAVLRLLK